MRFIQYLAVVGMAALAACGQEPAAQSAPTVTSQGDFTFEPGSFDTLINRARAQRGLSPLRVSVKLTTAARAHANDMSRGEFFSHYSSDGRSVGARVAATGYGHCWVSENISWNRKSEAEVFARWMASPGHRRNMLASDPTEYGLAVATGHYRVLVLGAPGC